MEPTKDTTSVPFLTRKMLAFENGVAFGLKLQIQSDTTFTVAIRGMTREGVFTLKFPVTGDSANKTQTFRIPDLPIMVSVSDDGGSLSQGSCYAALSLTANGDVIETLCAGLLNQGKGIAYPNQDLKDQREGGGSIQSKVSSDPAANTEISVTVPVGEMWRIISAEFRLVSDANAANRRVHLVFTDPQGIDGIHCFALVDQTASQTIKYSVAKYGGSTDELDNNVNLISLPDEMWVNQGGTISTATTNRQVGDNFGVMTILYEKFFVAN